MRRAWIVCAALALVACASRTEAPIPEADVKDFVRKYTAAGAAGDATRLMEFLSRNPGVSSVAQGKIVRGWEAIRTATDEELLQNGPAQTTVGTMDVTALGENAALVVAPIQVTWTQNNQTYSYNGAMTLVVNRTGEGLRLIHEHYSSRPQ